jgi:hypothetical protein
MNFLRRKVRPEETAPAETPRIIHRETEITVEREWIAIGYTPPHPGSPPGSGVAEPEILPPALPPPTRID